MTVVPVVLVTFVVVVQQARFQDHYHGGASRPETRYVPCICLLIYPYILLWIWINKQTHKQTNKQTNKQTAAFIFQPVSLSPLLHYFMGVHFVILLFGTTNTPHMQYKSMTWHVFKTIISEKLPGPELNGNDQKDSSFDGSLYSQWLGMMRAPRPSSSVRIPVKGHKMTMKNLSERWHWIQPPFYDFFHSLV